MPDEKTSGLRQYLLQTLSYADIFNYPLKTEELEKWLIGIKVSDRERVREELTNLTLGKIIEQKGEYFFIKGRSKLVGERERRKKCSEEKWLMAVKTAEKIKKIPGIELVGVTGALAMNNTEENDDIDLLIITRENSLWLTRLLIILFAPILNIRRRKPKELEVKNKICFNLFLEKNHLKIKPENLFLAHEVCQMRPVFDRSNVYEKFIRENLWVKKYLPNAVNKIKIKQDSNSSLGTIAALLSSCLAVVNRLAFFLQSRYMGSKKTIERVTLYQAFFHPENLSDKVLNKLKSYSNK